MLKRLPWFFALTACGPTADSTELACQDVVEVLCERACECGTNGCGYVVHGSINYLGGSTDFEGCVENARTQLCGGSSSIQDPAGCEDATEAGTCVEIDPEDPNVQQFEVGAACSPAD